LAEWLEDRYGIKVPELTEDAQLKLDWRRHERRPWPARWRRSITGILR
jgi:hypothetical protein